MNPFAAPVLLGAGLVSAPAFWGAFVAGTNTPGSALVRFLVSALLVWAALAVLGFLVGPAPRGGVEAAATTGPAAADAASETGTTA